MSQDNIRFLEHLIYSHFGQATGEIASILLNRGSLSFDHIRRLSSLTSKTVHASLAVLSLHSLIYHSDPAANAGQHQEIELYEMNFRAIEERMRLGIYGKLAEKWLKDLIKQEGSKGMWLEGLNPLSGGGGRCMALVIKCLMVEGMVLETDLIQVISNELMDSGLILNKLPEKKVKGKSKVVQSTNTSEASSDSLAYNEMAKKILMRALKSNIISVVTHGSQLSPSSLEIKWLAQLKLNIKGVPTAKEVARMKEEVIEMKEQFALDERTLASGLEVTDRNDGPPRKKARNYSVKLDEGIKGTPLPRGAFYRINTEKLHIRWRSELMCEFVRDRYNPIIAEVFSTILSIAEPEVETLAEPISTPISSHELLASIESIRPRLDLTNCYAPPPIAEKNIPAGKWKLPTNTSTILHEICNDLADRRDNEAPIETPLGHSKEFLSAVGSGGSAGMRWKVEFGHCGARMKRCLVEAMVRDKVGQVGVRCWRIIDGKGKLDEKHLATLALLPVKESRETLASLSSYSLIECQEVPRSADRAPSRTFFLWYVDYPKVIQTLLSHQFKALANLQAQRTYQLEKKEMLVKKRERSDVVEGGEELFLTKRERDGLEELDRILEALATAEQRIDRDIFVLRDMDP